jgi:hypothetical protein
LDQALAAVATIPSAVSRMSIAFSIARRALLIAQAMRISRQLSPNELIAEFTPSLPFQRISCGHWLRQARRAKKGTWKRRAADFFQKEVENRAIRVQERARRADSS